MNSNTADYISMLYSDDKEVRAKGSRLLSSTGNEGVCAASKLLNDSDWHIRYRACEAIGFSHESCGVDFLIPMLDDEKDHVRYMAVKSLSMCGTKEHLPDVLRMLDDENHFVRRIAKKTAEEWSGADNFFKKGLELYAARKFSDACEFFSAAIDLRPDNVNYHYYRGVCLCELGKMDDAVLDYSFALERVPGCVPIRYNRAELYLEMGDNDSAEADFSKIIDSEISEDNKYWLSLSFLGRGILKLDAGDIDSAISDCTAAEDLANEIGDKGLIARIGKELERNGF